MKTTSYENWLFLKILGAPYDAEIPFCNCQSHDLDFQGNISLILLPQAGPVICFFD